KRRDRAGLKKTTAELRERHAAAARDLTSDAKQLKTLGTVIDRELVELAEIARQILAAPNRLTAAISDRIVARGERLAARLFTAALRSSGVEAEYVEATRVIYANGRHGDAAPDFRRTARAVRAEIVPLMKRGVVPVVPGFVARGPKDAIVTLGRGGSDLTATLLAC